MLLEHDEKEILPTKSSIALKSETVKARGCRQLSSSARTNMHQHRGRKAKVAAFVNYDDCI